MDTSEPAAAAPLGVSPAVSAVVLTTPVPLMCGAGLQHAEAG